MSLTVAVLGAGAMGSAVAQRLVNHGCKVLTHLEGRSAVTMARARAAGMIAASLQELVEAQFILSIVPPGVAGAAAEQLLPVLVTAARKPLYVDCNAVSPRTVVEIGKIIARSGCGFVDAGIIGGPPPVEKGSSSVDTIFYASGAAAPRFAELIRYGLNIRVMQGEIGCASAAKMAFAGVTKGVTAIGTAMLLAAARADVIEPLGRELARSRPDLLNWFNRQIPGMLPKAYRWVAEMEEIAEFSGDEATRQMYLGIARLYDKIACDLNGDGGEVAILKAALSNIAAQN